MSCQLRRSITAFCLFRPAAKYLRAKNRMAGQELVTG
jgi:hypothetical protein